MLCFGSVNAQDEAQSRYDIVISDGRIIDPETGLDAVLNIGINGQSIVGRYNIGGI
tara:strand:+ start:6250 stop:6417 length:168 start_codon:yes stop_codon:yes gene_type:complete